MDFTSRSNNEAFNTSSETYLSICSPFVGGAVKAYMEN